MHGRASRTALLKPPGPLNPSKGAAAHPAPLHRRCCASRAAVANWPRDVWISLPARLSVYVRMSVSLHGCLLDYVCVRECVRRLCAVRTCKMQLQ